MADVTKKPNVALDAQPECPEQENIESFGRWVKAWREYRGISLSEMARRAGWDAQFQNLLEKEVRRKKDGSPPMPREETVKIVAHVLNVSERDALLAAGYAPLDLRRVSYISAPRRSPEGGFIFFHISDIDLSDIHIPSTEHVAKHPSEKPDSSDVEVLHRLEQMIEELRGRIAEYDQRFQKLEGEQSIGYLVPQQDDRVSQATRGQTKSKKVSQPRIVPDPE